MPRLLPDGKGLLCATNQGLVLVDVASGSEIVRMQAWLNGDWLMTAPDGTFDGSEGSMRKLTLFDAAGNEMSNAAMATLRNPEALHQRIAGYVIGTHAGNAAESNQR